MKDTKVKTEVFREKWLAILEIGLIFLLFFLYAGWLPPDVNEAHYLAKAKHYWQPQWCAGDQELVVGTGDYARRRAQGGAAPVLRAVSGLSGQRCSRD